MKRLYLILALAGFVLPYYFFISFLAQHGLNLSLLVEQLFGTPISTFFAVDLIMTAIVFWVFVLQEARRLQHEPPLGVRGRDIAGWSVVCAAALFVLP